MNIGSATAPRLLLVPLLALLCGCPSPPVSPPSLVADPPPTEDGKPPGADITAMDRGKAFIQKEAWTEALVEFEQLVASDPSNAKSQYFRALSLKQLGRFDEAQGGFEKAIELDDGLVEARVHLGEALLNTDPPNASKAIEVLKPAVAAEPKAKDSRHLLAYAHYLEGQFGEAATHYAAVLEMGEDKDIHFQLADSLFRAGSVDESVVHMRKLVPLFNTDLEVVVLFADRFYKAKAHEDCVKTVDVALGLQPDNPAFFLRRGLCKHGLNKETQARADYAEAIVRNNKFQAAYFYLGKSWQSERRRAKALNAFQKAVSIDADSKVGVRAQAEIDKMGK